MTPDEPAVTADDMPVLARLVGLPLDPAEADDVWRWLRGLLEADAVVARAGAGDD